MRNHVVKCGSIRACLGSAIALLLSACLTIEENYSFKKDGSGTMEYVVDMSELAELLKGMEGLSDDRKDGSGDPMGDMEMSEQAKALKALPGVSKVKVKNEKDGYVQRLSFKFADLDALNGALNVLLPDSTGARHDFFQWEGSTLVRTNNRHAAELAGEMAEDEPDDPADMTGFLQSMHYKYSFAFSEPIADIGSAEGVAREAPSSKQVRLSTDWSVIMNDPKALDLRITLAR